LASARIESTMRLVTRGMKMVITASPAWIDADACSESPRLATPK
jgi:hypothetical protein